MPILARFPRLFHLHGLSMVSPFSPSNNVVYIVQFNLFLSNIYDSLLFNKRPFRTGKYVTVH